MEIGAATLRPISLFYSYSHRDEEFRSALETHLSVLRRSRLISEWHDRMIGAGGDWRGEIDRHLVSADIVLLLVSADFLASDYCWGEEMAKALQRHERGEARVIPVILRPCRWRSTPLAKLQAVPRDGKPVTDWLSRDTAFDDIAAAIERIIEDQQQERLRAAEEEERWRAEAEARRKAEGDRKRREQQEAEVRRKAEEEERRRAEAEAKRQAEEKERRGAEQEVKRKAEEERLRAEAKAARKAEEQRWKAEAQTKHREAEGARREAGEARQRAGAEAAPPAGSAVKPSPRPSGTQQPENEGEPADLAVFCDVHAPWCPELVVLARGSFLMGSPTDEKGRYANESPQHRVTIGYRFAIGRYAVTFDEFDYFCAATNREKPGDNGWGRGRRPVINVNWHDARAYGAWLAETAGKPFRLPTEAEWEYACRAGTTTRFSCGDQISRKQANCTPNIALAFVSIYAGKTKEVGSYPSNPWGLHEVHGNVWEWVEDCYHDSYQGAPQDGSPWTAGKYSDRVARGGSWLDIPRDLRSANRGRYGPDGRYVILGFRVARTLTP